MDFWIVYIIQAADDKLYTGITTNLIRRWKEHCGVIKKGAKFFRGRPPKQVVYWEVQPNRSEASKREAYIKSLSRSEKLDLLSA